MVGMKSILMSVMVLVLLCVPAWVQAEESLPVIKGIRVFRSGESLGVEISADKKFEYTCSKMPQLLRVVIDLPQTESATSDTVYKYKSVLISNIRLEKKNINDVDITRVSVNLAEEADYTIRTDASDNAKLTLLFRKSAPGPTAGTAAAMPGSASKGGPALAKPAAQAAPTAPAASAASAAAPAPVSASKLAMPGTGQPVTVTGVKFGADAIEIQSNGNISEFKAFTLQQPGRLVIDIPGAQSALRSIAIPANAFGVLKTRIALFEGKLRIVLDAGKKQFPHYEVVKAGTGLRILSRVVTQGK